jgi:putative oxidoreductase
VDLGILLLRLVVGGLLIGHGTQKLFGWFGGAGPDAMGDMFRTLGYRRGRDMARLAGATETAAGALFVLGFLTPLAAAAVIGIMLNAIVVVHGDRGPWINAGGWEYNAVLAAVAAMLAFAGPGMVSLDRGLALGTSGLFWGLGAILLGCVTGAFALSTRETSRILRPARDEHQVAA